MFAIVRMCTGVFCLTLPTPALPRILSFLRSPRSRLPFSRYLPPFSNNSSTNFPHWHLSTTSHQSNSLAKEDSVLMPSSGLPLSTFSLPWYSYKHLLTCTREQIQNARENPLAAAAAAAAVTGTTPPPQAQSNVENLLDIDFDGGAPASAQKEPENGLSGLEGLSGTPVRAQSPATPAAAPSNNLDDLLGVFGDGGAPAPSTSAGPSTAAPSGGAGAGDSAGASAGAGADLLNGLDGLDIGGNSTTSPPPATSGGQQKKTNEDILSLF